MIYDKDIREPLFDFLDDLYFPNRIIEEKRMGKSRADVVMVTPEAIYGIEIKSDADTYVRLARQVKDYDKFYDYNIVVIGTSHARHICEHVPKHWGIITVEKVDDRIDFYVLREPLLNPKMKWKYKLSILWRPELVSIQAYFNLPKYKDKSKRFVVEKIIEKVPEMELQKQFCHELMERDYNEIANIIEEYKTGRK